MPRRVPCTTPLGRPMGARSGPTEPPMFQQRRCEVPGNLARAPGSWRPLDRQDGDAAKSSMENTTCQLTAAKAQPSLGGSAVDTLGARETIFTQLDLTKDAQTVSTCGTNTNKPSSRPWWCARRTSTLLACSAHVPILAAQTLPPTVHVTYRTPREMGPLWTVETCGSVHGTLLPNLAAAFSTLPATCHTLNWERSAVADCSRQRTLQPHWKHTGDFGSAQGRDAEHVAAPHEKRSTASSAHGTPWQTK